MPHPSFLLATLLVSSALTAQLSTSGSPNIAAQPPWGPTGHDHVTYYYLPDVDSYYDVPRHAFYYYEDGRWMGAPQLPPRFSSYDVYHAYKVVINETNAYNNNDKHKAQYSGYRGRYDQPMIRDSKDPKYYVVKGHPEHDKWANRQGHDNGKEDAKGDKKEHKQ